MKKIFLSAMLGLSLLAFSKPVLADEADLEPIKQKLDRILANQDTIMQQLEALRSEIEIVKVRSTT